MNFSNTKKLSKLLSLILAMALVLSLFAGCSKQGNEDTQPESKPNLNLVDGTEPQVTEPSVPETTEPEITDNTARVNSQLSVRNVPSKDGGTVGTLDAGDLIEVTQVSIAASIWWGRINEPYSGWVCMDYVTLLNPNGPIGLKMGSDANTDTTTPTEGESNGTTQTQSFKGVITANDLNIRNDAGTNGTTIVGKYRKGDVVTILETKDGWGRTSLGWILLEYVKSNDDSGNKTDTGTTGGTDKTDTSKTDTGKTDTGNGSDKVIAQGIVLAGDLNVRSSPSTAGDRIKSLSYGTWVEIYEKSDGWGRTKDGWISLNYIYQDGTKTNDAIGGVVTGSGLNIRQRPNTTSDSLGSYSAGTYVEILAQFTSGDYTWGRTEKGWIRLDYVYLEGADVGESGNGTVNTDGLNIRKGPGTGYESVGSYNEGDEVVILYQLEVGETTWGCVGKGRWISLKYVDVG